jgi:hypothetical protein
VQLVRILAVTPDEKVFAAGLEHARHLLRMLQVPDPRVQLAASQVLAECAERVRLRIEEIARQEEDRASHDQPGSLSPWDR